MPDDRPLVPGMTPPSRMVDVGDKPLTARRAVAEGLLEMPAVARARFDAAVAADRTLLETARVTGIMAGKRTSDLLPLCHPLTMDHLSVEIEEVEAGLRIRAVAATRSATGVEMEALTAVAMTGLALIAAVTGMAATGGGSLPGGIPPLELRLGEIRLMAKSGGRSGEYRASDHPARGA